jgi:hypothetical protein
MTNPDTIAVIVGEMRESIAKSNATNTYMRCSSWADRLAALGWRPIESAPKDGTYILASDGEDEGCAVVRWDCDGWCYAWHEYDGPMQMHSATHWMPLPAATTGVSHY